VDKQEAKLLLQALRPAQLDASQPVIAEVLAMVEKDSELKAWWEAQQSFDLKVSAKLREIQVPDELRSMILAGRKIEQFRPQPHFSWWLAAAAAVAILCVAGTLRQVSLYGPLAKNDYAHAALTLLNHDHPELAMISSDHEKIVAWLKERSAPLGAMPDKMASLQPIGCQKYDVHGHAVTLICFVLAGGAEAHLFMVDKQALNDPPPNNVPQYNQMDEWATASWSDGTMTFMLATTAGPDALKQLL